MQLTLHTDYGLRVLILLAHGQRAATTDEMAEALDVSKHHLVKVVQTLARHGWVRTLRGRAGGVELTVDPEMLNVGDVTAALEGKDGVLACVVSPEVCVLEPGCRLRRQLMAAEEAFYDVLRQSSLADLVRRPAPGHGLTKRSLRERPEDH